MVVPWLLGAWLLYRAIGTIWPLIIGHALYDAALLTTMRTGHTWPYTALQIAAGIGAILLVTTVARTANRTDWSACGNQLGPDCSLAISRSMRRASRTRMLSAPLSNRLGSRAKAATTTTATGA